MGIQELEAALQAIPDGTKSDGVEFMLPMREHEMLSFMQRFAKWLEGHPVTHFTMTWDGTNARVKLAY